jgi:aminoglycoside 6-adenylyltransferase
MRSEKDIITSLLTVAEADERVRTVMLTGSRTIDNRPADDYQDFDVVYFVTDLTSFRANPQWIDVFGERIITQLPNSMRIDDADPEPSGSEIVYLMLFTDFNRIDLRLVELGNREYRVDSLHTVLLDKDGLFDPVPEPSESDYLVRRPSQKEFADCCNEFWWVTTYVVKGLGRNEPLYARAMLEGPVRKMFLRMLGWSVGTQTGFSVNLGQSYRFLKRYVSSTTWVRILKTYPNAEIPSIRSSLVEMTALFHETGVRVARELDLLYNFEEADKVKTYIGDRLRGAT